MTEFPVPLDALITYVKSLIPGGTPLDDVSSAMTVSARLDEQSDALIGHFVDQARRSGASWSQIGASMGVSKQAAQKRFVLRSLLPEGQAMFSRFTPRSANVLAAAARLAGRTDQPVDAAHLAAGLLTEPDGIAARMIRHAGLTDEQYFAAVGAGPAEPQPDTDHATLSELNFTADCGTAFSEALKAALRLGHNYIGTEHLLLGLLAADGPISQNLAAAQLDTDTADRLLADEFARLKAERQQAKQG
ncbi:MAG TPA: Clp protease N-terminal domain-containing protein [Streptosporangiaceae bacterium]|nr:Clp protease N-terminal domain-containing protein [Streptosporangiaceae bacterium]